MGVLLLGLLVIIWVAGLVREFPVWALPALGLVLFFVSVIPRLMVEGLVFSLFTAPQFGGWPDSLSLRILLMLFS